MAASSSTNDSEVRERLDKMLLDFLKKYGGEVAEALPTGSLIRVLYAKGVINLDEKKELLRLRDDKKANDEQLADHVICMVEESRSDEVRFDFLKLVLENAQCKDRLNEATQRELSVLLGFEGPENDDRHEDGGGDDDDDESIPCCEMTVEEHMVYHPMTSDQHLTSTAAATGAAGRSPCSVFVF